jgi:hypothetical protein
MSTTPNLHLILPPHGLPNWDIPVNQNFVILDGVVGGLQTSVGVLQTTLVLGFIITSGATGVNVGPVLIAARTGSLTKCKIAVKTSDVATGLTIQIRKNGFDIFALDPSLAPGASGLTTFTTFTTNPLPVTADDLFTIDITSGSANWAFTAQLE